MDNKQKEILSLLDRWIAAVSSADVDAIVSLYDEEAVLCATLSSSIRTTPAQIRHYFELFTKNREQISIIYHHPQVRVYGDIALNSGYYIFFFETDGEMKNLSARYTFVYRRIGENWRIVEHHSSQMLR